MEHAKLKKSLTHRKEFFEIEDTTEYKRVRVQLHARGVLLRDIVKGSKIKTKKQQACKGGDFIVAEIDAKVGGYGFIPGDLEGAIVSSHYYLFEVDESVLLPQFLHYCTQTPEFAAQLTAQGSTNYAAVRPHDVLDVSIPLPSLARQRELVSWLDAVTENIARKHQHLEQSAADLAVLRQRILHDAVQGKLTERDPDDEPASALLARIEAEKKRLVKAGAIRKPKTLPPVGEDEQPFDVPEGWVWTRVGDAVLDIQTGPFGSTLGKSDYVKGEIPVVNPTNIADGYIKADEAKTINSETLDRLSSYQITVGDIVIARRGEMGRCAVVTHHEDGWLCGTGCLFLRLTTEIYPPYLAQFIRSPQTRSTLEGDSVGSTMSNLNQRIFRGLALPLPPYEEQIRIVERIEQVSALCDCLETKLAAAERDAERMMGAVLEEILSPSKAAA